MTQPQSDIHELDSVSAFTSDFGSAFHELDASVTHNHPLYSDCDTIISVQMVATVQLKNDDEVSEVGQISDPGTQT